MTPWGWIADRFNRREERFRISRLEADLRRLRRVLEFYANERHYPDYIVAGQSKGGVIYDRGGQAQLALYVTSPSPYEPPQ